VDIATRAQAPLRVYGFLHSVFQQDILRIFLDEMRDDFRVRLGLKLVPFRDQLMLQLEIILDNSVMNYDNLASPVAVRMRVLFSRAALRRPASMSEELYTLDRRFF
jgi:hypothetical protein